MLDTEIHRVTRIFLCKTAEANHLFLRHEPQRTVLKVSLYFLPAEHADFDSQIFAEFLA